MATDSLPLNALTAVSPLDGRYHHHTAPLRAYFSEFAVQRARLDVEVEWLIYLSQHADIGEAPALAAEDEKFLRELSGAFSLSCAQRIKTIEASTRHDVKAVEYFIKERLQDRPNLAASAEFVHFACTSEDINNLACALLLKRALPEQIMPPLRAVIAQLRDLARAHAAAPMLARTHGQPASPTTMGKELAIFAHRLDNAAADLADMRMLGKFNGASGNFNAHLAAYPNLDWPTMAREFVEQLGLVYQPMSTQIEAHDFIAQMCHGLCRINTILLDLNRDAWGYVSLGYFRQKTAPGEVGSSAMPHKINPIDFENAEGNLGLANALLTHFAAKLPVSRWQRDLSDSTVLRNLGVAIGHGLLAAHSTQRGLAKLALNPARLRQDLEHCWEVLAEPIQTVMRRYGIAQPYEKLKALTRGAERIDRATVHAFIADLAIPAPAKRRLLALTPATYIGFAAEAAHGVGDSAE